MNKQYIKVLVIALFISLVLFNINIPLHAADVGNAFGSSGFSSSSSSDGSSFIVFELITNILYTIIYFPFPFNVIIILALIYFGFKSANAVNYDVQKYQINKNIQRNEAIQLHQNEINSDLAQIRQADPAFSKFELESYAKELYLMIEEAIEGQDSSLIAKYVNKEYLAKIVQKIEIIKENNKRQIFDGQEFLSAEIKDIIFHENQQEVILELFINEKSAMIGRDEDRNKVTGRRNKAIELTFIRSNDVQTNSTRLSVTNCQSCGAPNSIEDNGICEYCGSNLTVDYTGWVLISENLIAERSSIYFKKYSSGVLSIHNNETNIVTQVQQHDSTFVQEEFEKYVAESFIAVQEGWENRDMQSVRKFESDELYRTHKQQITEYIEKNQYPFLENQTVNDVHLNEFIIDGKNEYLNVIVDCNLQVFLKDESGKIIDGSHNINNNGYKLRFKRALGVKSKILTLSSCPNCGAPLEFGESGECLYCQSFVTNGEHGWVLDSYEGLYQFKKGNINYRKTVYEKMKLKQQEQQTIE